MFTELEKKFMKTPDEGDNAVAIEALEEEVETLTTAVADLTDRVEALEAV